MFIIPTDIDLIKKLFQHTKICAQRWMWDDLIEIYFGWDIDKSRFTHSKAQLGLSFLNEVNESRHFPSDSRRFSLLLLVNFKHSSSEFGLYSRIRIIVTFFTLFL